MLSIQLWDVAGQDKFIGLAPTYSKYSVAAIVVFDITDSSSLQRAAKWKSDIDSKVFLRNGNNIPVVLFANKWDLVECDRNKSIASDEELDTFCAVNHFVGWFTASAKTGLNIKKGVNYILKRLINDNIITTSNDHKGTVVKILVVGANNAGKTSIVTRYIHKTFDNNHCATVGVDFALKRVRLPSSINQTKLKNTIGLSVNGAKDIGNFRKCIDNNIQPKVGSITYNGLLYEYKFDTTTINNEIHKVNDIKCDNNSMLFYPTYCFAKVKENKCYNYYMSVGLNSNIKSNEFKRKHLNLVIVLDISGSMNCSLNNNNTKIYIAKKSIIALFTHLTDYDRFALIVFNGSAQVLQCMEFMRNINKDKLKDNILNINATSCTNLECGYVTAIRMYKYITKDLLYSNRIIFLTDAQPNEGITDSNGLLDLISMNALNKYMRIYCSVIGIGLDFNVLLVNKIMKTRGCNYYSVNSETEFINKMDKEFEYMVTPLVFNVVLRMKSEGNACCIDKVYGSNECKDNVLRNGEMIKMNTLFASNKNENSGEIQGGILLIKLKRNNEMKCDNNMNVIIEVIYEDRNENKYKNEQNISFADLIKKKNVMKMNDMIENDEKDKDEINFNNFYDNNGIRKGILLCKYCEVLMEWIEFEGKRGTKELRINTKYRNKFIGLLNDFEMEMKFCDDERLQKEVDILKILSELVVKNEDNKSVLSYFSSMYNGIVSKWYSNK